MTGDAGVGGEGSESAFGGSWALAQQCVGFVERRPIGKERALIAGDRERDSDRRDLRSAKGVVEQFGVGPPANPAGEPAGKIACERERPRGGDFRDHVGPRSVDVRHFRAA